MNVRPFLPTPFTEVSVLFTPYYRPPSSTDFCGQLQLKVLDCLEAYGVRNAKTKCAELVYDSIECKRGVFQKKRAKAIREERMRQFRAGKLDKPFDEYPPLEGFLYI